MNSRIVSKQKKVAKAQMELTATIRKVQKNCKHDQQAECEYLSSSVFGDASPPMRICLVCGLTEEGWGFGYKVLKNDDLFVGKIARDSLYQLRNGQTITNSLKGPLLRGEISLNDIIDGNGKPD